MHSFDAFWGGTPRICPHNFSHGWVTGSRNSCNRADPKDLLFLSSVVGIVIVDVVVIIVIICCCCSQDRRRRDCCRASDCSWGSSCGYNNRNPLERGVDEVVSRDKVDRWAGRGESEDGGRTGRRRRTGRAGLKSKVVAGTGGPRWLVLLIWNIESSDKVIDFINNVFIILRKRGLRHDEDSFLSPFLYKLYAIFAFIYLFLCIFLNLFLYLLFITAKEPFISYIPAQAHKHSSS